MPTRPFLEISLPCIEYASSRKLNQSFRLMICVGANQMEYAQNLLDELTIEPLLLPRIAVKVLRRMRK